MSETTAEPKVVPVDSEALAEAFYRTADRLRAQRPLTDADIRRAEERIATARRRQVRIWMVEFLAVLVFVTVLITVWFLRF